MSNVLGNLKTETVQVEFSSGEGSWNKGEFQPPTKLTRDVVASVQPMNASDIFKLPEGERTKEWLKMYTEDRIFESQEDRNQQADVVIRDGKRFKVKGVANYNIGTSLPHYKVMLCKMDGEGGPE